MKISKEDLKRIIKEELGAKERDVIVQVRKIMTAYAEKNNLASGNVLALLTKITDKMKAKIEQPEPQNK